MTSFPWFSHYGLLKKTWLQLSLGNLCTLYNFVYIIIHITSNADALWACHTVFLKHCMTSPKSICVWEANHSFWNLKNPLAIYFFSLHTAHNKETSERDCLVWMYCPNKHVITGRCQKHAIQMSLLDSKMFHACLSF